MDVDGVPPVVCFHGTGPDTHSARTHLWVLGIPTCAVQGSGQGSMWGDLRACLDEGFSCMEAVKNTWTGGVGWRALVG